MPSEFFRCNDCGHNAHVKWLTICRICDASIGPVCADTHKQRKHGFRKPVQQVSRQAAPALTPVRAKTKTPIEQVSPQRSFFGDDPSMSKKTKSTTKRQRANAIK